jgi:hypothetical protein
MHMCYTTCINDGAIMMVYSMSCTCNVTVIVTGIVPRISVTNVFCSQILVFSSVSSRTTFFAMGDLFS